jgi:hypothetical protein
MLLRHKSKMRDGTESPRLDARLYFQLTDTLLD